MTRKFFVLSAALTVGLTITTAVPLDPSARAEAQRRTGGRADLNYVANAAASDMYEIESSRLALQRSQRAEVREFAQMMIDHHTRTTQQVADAARRDGLTPPPPMLMAPQRQMLRQLERARAGRAFDQLYISQQTSAHQQALTLHRSRARMRDGSALTQVANQTVPIIQQHQQQLRRVSRRR